MKTTNYMPSFSAMAIRQLGLTLVELLVALTIGLLLLAGVSSIFVTTRSTYTMEEGMGRTQEGGRFAMDFLAQDIRMAGYAGCNTPNVATVCSASTTTNCSNNIVVPPGTASDAYKLLSGGLRGYLYSGDGTSTNLTDWTPSLPADYFSNGDVRANTDVIVVQHGAMVDTNLSATLASVTADITISNAASTALGIGANDILMITDCFNTDIFRVGAVTVAGATTSITHPAGTTNSSASLSKTYDNTNAQLMKLVSRAYYVGTGTGGEPSLMRKDLSAPLTISSQELVQGIEFMRLMFNESVAAGKTIYNDAGAVAIWNNVNAVRVGLLLRTPTTVDQEVDNSQFTDGAEIVDGVLMRPGTEFAYDHRRRQIFKSTIMVRH